MAHLPTFKRRSTFLKLILVHRTNASRTIEFGRWSWALLSACMLGLPLGLMTVSYQLGQTQGATQAGEARLSDAELLASERAELLAQLSADAERKLQTMTLTLAELQARVTRLDALGMQITELSGLDNGEFDFTAMPALGGPMAPLALTEAQTVSGIDAEFLELSATLTDRETQLDVLAGLLFDQKTHAESVPSGRPVTAGWLSSHFGSRTDPFSGRKAWHQGIDFAGREGADVIAVASGVVSWSGDRSGYGTMIEVAHGDGLVTRYAHNQKNLVEVGDLVRKGESIALMGNSGRSTGPHVHFEVYKHGRPVDPSSYIHRNKR